mgnify:CR=1 FL=1
MRERAVLSTPASFLGRVVPAGSILTLALALALGRRGCLTFLLPLPRTIGLVGAAR